MARDTLLTAAFLTAVSVVPAASAVCSEQTVTVRGEISRFEVLAKAKARGNWRAKVRAMPSLGAAYADWNKALAADYSCTEHSGRYVCVATAYPCRD